MNNSSDTMTSLTDWLLIQLAADEAAARASSFQTHRWKVGMAGAVEEAISIGFHPVADVYDDADVAVHIANHDPARVLAEINAKREIIAKCQHRIPRESLTDRLLIPMAQSGWDALADATLRALAQPFVGRPGFREEWAS